VTEAGRRRGKERLRQVPWKSHTPEIRVVNSRKRKGKMKEACNRQQKRERRGNKAQRKYRDIAREQQLRMKTVTAPERWR